LIESRSTRPALLGVALISAGGLMWYHYLPPSAKAALYAAPVLNIFMGLLFVATGIVFVLLFFGPYRNPGWIKTPGFAASILLFGIIGMSTAEFIREAVRKPYICYNVVLGSQMLTDEVAAVREKGFLECGVWTKAFVKDQYPQLMTADDHVDRARLRDLPKMDQIKLGGVIFQYHCNDCHTLQQGYSPVGPLVQGWKPERIRDLVTHLSQERFTMPPWTGMPEEADLLTAYLSDIAPKRPEGMMPEEAKKEAR
jgi:mono/diheme cytochrome c family protein